MGSLNRHVLILNQNYEPMSVITAKKAIVLIVLGKAEIIERHPLWEVRSVRSSLPFPSIVRLITYIHIPRKRVILSRKNIIKRDNGRCQYCGTTQRPLTVDHVVPKNRGGEDSWENLVCACVACNNRKGNRTPEEARMPMLRKPQRPNQLYFIQHFIGIGDERWKPYLFMN
ncbi:MAG: HNH endonuclease [candidate division KSB1 bacterium]|nr:HNH endonuclease [candidate division KSB1 bacterium]MDZ7275236.1 HNH endonuclease [candidate division KSB1 bacterium]MDZ7287404.1 HNH endonuclease [candidate division KSB1 bacterium]MDZ7299518.1 HNH endonuclease [candidate division KSB1 bacterium]MDZ7305437.1 HNH endonuclease [candidate division KSB1 bacterium]